MNNTTEASDISGRILNLEIRGLEECQYLRTLVSGEVVGDLVEQLKRMIPELIEAEDIKVYQGKYLILKEENLNILNINEEVIVTITKKQNSQVDSEEYFEECVDMRVKIEDEDSSDLMNDEQIKQMNEELRTREEICKQREERTIYEEGLVNKMRKVLDKKEERLKVEEKNLYKKKLNVKYNEAKSQRKEDELNEKVEFQNKILQDLEDKQEILNNNQEANQREKELLQKNRDDQN